MFLTTEIARSGYVAIKSGADLATVRAIRDAAVAYGDSQVPKGVYSIRGAEECLRDVDRLIETLPCLTQIYRDELHFDAMPEVSESHIIIRYRRDRQPGDQAYVGHLDGTINPAMGHVEYWPFHLLVAVFLTPIHSEDHGNFVLWPESHKYVAEQCRLHGVDAILNAQDGGRSLFEKYCSSHAPVQIKASAGDVLLCHPMLIHTGGRNYSGPNRIAAFARIGHSYALSLGHTLLLDASSSFMPPARS